MTDQNTIRWEQDTNGVVTLVLDAPGRRANTMNDAFRASLAAVVERLVTGKNAITGVIVTSAKDSFLAGGDLRQLIQITDANAARFAAGVEQTKACLRTLETLGRPVVAALGGSALGGGLELALACHHRIALDTPGARFGLPEVTFGLLPGGGGVARTTRLLGVLDALTKVLLEGTRYTPARAMQVGLVDDLAASREELLAKARAWIAAHPRAVQRWDAEDYVIPGGTPASPGLAPILPTLPATLRKKLKGAPRTVTATALTRARQSPRRWQTWAGRAACAAPVSTTTTAREGAPDCGRDWPLRFPRAAILHRSTCRS